jgi:pilus assembly protein TadC
MEWQLAAFFLQRAPRSPYLIPWHVLSLAKKILFRFERVMNFFYADFLLIYMALGLGINLTQVYFHRGNYKYFLQ